MLCIVSVPEWEGVGAAPECWGAVTPPCPSSWSSQWDLCLLFVCVQFGNFWDIYIYLPLWSTIIIIKLYIVLFYKIHMLHMYILKAHLIHRYVFHTFSIAFLE